MYSDAPSIISNVIEMGDMVLLENLWAKINSLKKYISNNFADGYKHDGISLMLKPPNKGKFMCFTTESKLSQSFAIILWNVGSN